ncbi:MAG TPA: hypothetical protein VKK79_10600, partial [Candidatus Lokiarchaeia archaeon]|nr:hypothetical protein [Candidatus Lokiarchaeia archaeon]
MGQVPDSGNTNEEEKDQLDDVEALLDSKIKDAVSKQIKRLADTADGVDDPADALALLYQGKDIFNSVKMARMSKIDDTLPQPAEINTCAYIGLPLPEEDLLPEAFSNMDTADLYQALIDMQQEAIGRWSDLTKPLYPTGVTPDVDQQNQETFAQILDYLEQVGAAHYEIVRAGLYLHIFLSQLYDKWGAFPFLSGKGYVEAALLRYNAHTPYLAVGLEEQELQG